ncbi:MAG: response regulator [Bacteriovoracaceae bacterium]|jgi:CheY-like chemotaxis protein|nr:response regulator [Bacteriovoracaceae bacterium]
MSNIEILIIDEDERVHQDLEFLLEREFGATIHHCYHKDEAIQLCKEKVYSLVVIDPMLPSSFDGEEYIKNQRQFYSINMETPIIIFTEDIDFVSKIATDFALHPESKQGPVSKILNPIKCQLEEHLNIKFAA